MHTTLTYFPTVQAIEAAALKLKGVASVTPLNRNTRFSKDFQSDISFKREDLQDVRSYKIRGAYNKMASLTTSEIENGIVCASAGNHAQGVALSCKLLKVKGTIYMPAPTPNQKIDQVKMFGEDAIDIVLVGDTFDDAYSAAKLECERLNKTFIHPFNDEKVIEGQATMGLEILSQTNEPIDYLFVPVGGGGLASGISTLFKDISSNTKVIGVEPEGAPSMSTSIRNNRNTELKHIENFVDGAAVRKVGDINFAICKENLDAMITVPEGNMSDHFRTL